MTTPGGLDGVRYLHLGPDPIAKRLYALVIASARVQADAQALLRQHLRDRGDNWLGSTPPSSGERD